MNLSLKDRILRACHEVEKPLFFSTAHHGLRFIPLFAMTGPEGQISGRWRRPTPSRWAAPCCWP